MNKAKKEYYKNYGIKVGNHTNDFDADNYIKELEAVLKVAYDELIYCSDPYYKWPVDSEVLNLIKDILKSN